MVTAGGPSSGARWEFFIYLRTPAEIRGSVALGFSSLTQYLTHTYQTDSAEAHKYARAAG